MAFRDEARSPAFVIVVRDYIVAQDIALTIRDDIPHAHIVTASTLIEAEQALSPIPKVHMAFVAADPDEFERSDLAPTLEKRGARIVMMGLWPEAGQAASKWQVLQYPFTTEDVRIFVSSVRRNLQAQSVANYGSRYFDRRRRDVEPCPAWSQKGRQFPS
jgi:hypothetical protein